MQTKFLNSRKHKISALVKISSRQFLKKMPPNLITLIFYNVLRMNPEKSTFRIFEFRYFSKLLTIKITFSTEIHSWKKIEIQISEKLIS